MTGSPSGPVAPNQAYFGFVGVSIFRRRTPGQPLRARADAIGLGCRASERPDGRKEVVTWQSSGAERVAGRIGSPLRGAPAAVAAPLVLGVRRGHVRGLRGGAGLRLVEPRFHEPWTWSWHKSRLHAQLREQERIHIHVLLDALRQRRVQACRCRRRCAAPAPPTPVAACRQAVILPTASDRRARVVRPRQEQHGRYFSPSLTCWYGE